MKSLISLFAVLLLLSSCHENNSANSTSSISLADTANERQQVAQVEEGMFNAIKNNDPAFWNKVSNSYITINADGVMANKQQTIADSTRRKMFAGIDHKLFDHTIKVFANVGICNGRAQFFMKDQMVAEIYYTAIFRKENGIWIYEGWQGTMTKNNPKQPG